VFASLADAVIIRDEADRNSEKQSAGFVGFHTTRHNMTSGGYGIQQNQDIASSKPDGHGVLGLQLANSAPELAMNMVPAVLSPVPQVVALVSPYQGLQILGASTAETESSPIVGQIAPMSNHGIAVGLGFEQRDQDQSSSIFAGSGGTVTGQEISGLGLHEEPASAQLEHETDSSVARQASSLLPGYGNQNLGQISSFSLGFNNIFPKHGYSLIPDISDLKDVSSLGSGTSSLGHRPNIALGSEKINVGNVLQNTDIHLASGYTEESAASDYENPNIIYGKNNLLGSDNSNMFSRQPQKFGTLAEHLDSTYNSNLKEGLNVENGSLFGTEKTNPNVGYSSGTGFNSPGLEQGTVLGDSSTGTVVSFGSSLGHDSNVFRQDQILNFDTGSDASNFGHTRNTNSGSGNTEIGEVSSGMHQTLESAQSSFSASNHDLGNPGQRKISGSVRDLSNGAGLYFTALEKDSNLNSAFSLSTSYHGTGRPNQEHSLDSSARAGSHFTTRGKHTNSGSSSIPSVLRHGPKFRAGTGSSKLGHPSSRPTYSVTGSVRPSHTVSGNILGQGSSLQGQTSLVGARYYRPTHASNNGASYRGHTSQRGVGLRHRPISNNEVGKGNPGFKQTSQPGTGFDINSFSNIETVNTGTRDSSLLQYDQGFGTGSFMHGKGSGSSILGSLIPGNQRGLGSQISNAGNTATSTSNFNLGN
jgi:hypothetical protein